MEGRQHPEQAGPRLRLCWVWRWHRGGPAWHAGCGPCAAWTHCPVVSLPAGPPSLGLRQAGSAGLRGIHPPGLQGWVCVQVGGEADSSWERFQDWEGPHFCHSERPGREAEAGLSDRTGQGGPCVRLNVYPHLSPTRCQLVDVPSLFCGPLGSSAGDRSELGLPRGFSVLSHRSLGSFDCWRMVPGPSSLTLSGLGCKLTPGSLEALWPVLRCS